MDNNDLIKDITAHHKQRTGHINQIGAVEKVLAELMPDILECILSHISTAELENELLRRKDEKIKQDIDSMDYESMLPHVRASKKIGWD